MGRYTPNSAVQGDIGWKPTELRQWSTVINQWLRLKNMDRERLNRKIFDWAESNANRRCQNFNYRVNKMLEEAGLQYQFGVTNPAVFKRNLANYISEKFLSRWSEDVNRVNARHGSGQNKLRTYKLFKSVYEAENYLTCVMPHRHRSAYAKFRCGVAPIRLETGRYERLPQEQRICFNCQLEIENEEHVLLNCPLYNDLRRHMLNILSEEFPDIERRADQDRLTAILNCKLNRSVRTCAKTCFEILRKRRDLLYK